MYTDTIVSGLESQTSRRAKNLTPLFLKRLKKQPAFLINEGWQLQTQTGIVDISDSVVYSREQENFSQVISISRRRGSVEIFLSSKNRRMEQTRVFDLASGRILTNKVKEKNRLYKVLADKSGETPYQLEEIPVEAVTTKYSRFSLLRASGQ